MKNYIDKSVQQINNDVNREMWKISGLEVWYNEDVKRLKAWLNVLANYEKDIFNSKFNNNSKLDISLHNRHFKNDLLDYTNKAVDELDWLYRNKKARDILKFRNDVNNSIDKFERNVLWKIAGRCKEYFFTARDWTITFTDKVNPLRISDVIKWGDNLEIDYSGCTNQNIKSKIYNITWWSYVSKLKYERGSYILVDKNWKKLGNALIWEWVKIKKASTKPTTNTPTRNAPRTTSSNNWWRQERTTVERNQYSGEYLIWHKIEASNKNEIWWLWNSIMNWFQWYDGKSNFPNMDGNIWKTTTTHPNRFKSESDVRKYVSNHPWLKSFMFYFGVNTKDNDQTLSDITKRWNWLKNAWIQPVLCTCIWYDKPKWTHLVALNESLKTLGIQNWWPMIDFDRAYRDWKIIISGDWLHPYHQGYNNMANIIRNNLG